jgi:pilus assembly protein Flp/PilA
MNSVKKFLQDESGATAIEYGLIAAGISVVIITAVKSVGSNLSATFDSIADAMKGASGGGGSN